VSLTRKVVILQRKQKTAKHRRNDERSFLKTKSLANRSVSGLGSLQRRIDSSKEQLEDVSGILTQRMAQHESIQRLIANAQEGLRRENEAKEQAEQEVSFTNSDEEKNQAIARLRIITERIDELVDEIKRRTNTAKKISQGIEDYKKSSTKLATKIKIQTHSKPDLQKLIKTKKKSKVRRIKTKAKKKSKVRRIKTKAKKKSKVRRIKTKAKKKSKVRKRK
jgi:hypothetical protein